ncbi:MAG: hypothetical protein ABI551_06510 [Polyangiaceae bacterium]
MADAACSSDDSGGVHGATFGDDSGTTDGGHTLDGAPAESDGSTGTDGAPSNDGSAGGDGSTGSCTSGTVAVIGGGTTSFGATGIGDGAPVAQSITGGIGALPAILSFGTGFQAAYADASKQLRSTGFAGASWSTPTAIGDSAHQQPSLAAYGTSLLLAYVRLGDGGSYDLGYSTFNGTSWTAPGDITGAFSVQAPGVAGSGTSAVEGQVGSDGHIYVQQYATSGGAGTDVMSDGANLGYYDTPFSTGVRLAPLSGGSSDLVLVYTRTVDYKLMALTRTGGTWSTPKLANTNAYTTEAFNLAALAGGKAVIAWRGADTHGYATVFDGTSWSAPITVASFAIGSAPAVTAGNCSSLFIAAYAKTGGGVELVRYNGTAVSAPQSIASTTGASYVGVAVSP